MNAHLFIRDGRFAWSGYGASGDPSHQPYALVVDVSRDFIITDSGKLYLTGPGPMQFSEFSPEGFVLAARNGYFGFRVVREEQPASRQQDRDDQKRKKLGRRGRIAEDQRKPRSKP